MTKKSEIIPMLKMPESVLKGEPVPVRARKVGETRIRRDGTTWTYDPPRDPGNCLPKPPVEKKPTLVPCPHDPILQNNLASEMLEWVKTEEAEAIEQFPLARNMNPYKFYRIAEMNPYFADCLEASAAFLGFKMVQHAKKRTQDASVIMRLLPLYNKLYGDLALQKANAESTKVGTVIQVVESKIPGSDMVPERLVSDN